MLNSPDIFKALLFSKHHYIKEADIGRGYKIQWAEIIKLIWYHKQIWTEHSQINDMFDRILMKITDQESFFVFP